MSIIKSLIEAFSKREESIARLVSIFPNDSTDIYNNIRNLEIKTLGINWCIKYALSGKTWKDLKELF